MDQTTTQERFKRGAADAGRFFKYIADFVGFTQDDSATIRSTQLIVEKYIPSMVSGFYVQLLRFPATRRLFLKKDGTIDQDYLELRMQHQVNFWRRAASGVYEDDFARFVDYVGRSHTSHGADPRIYIPERYVIGMIGYVQQRIGEALHAELHDLDPDFEVQASKAWNKFLMVLLEMLSRSYSPEKDEQTFAPPQLINEAPVMQLAVETYERTLGIARSVDTKEVYVGRVEEIPEGERKIIQVDDLSIGVFHHRGQWVALHNSCLHRGGPVCEGKLVEDTLTCPWHGYEYDVKTGQLLFDPSAQLPSYPVEIRSDGIYIRIQTMILDEEPASLEGLFSPSKPAPAAAPLQANEFLISQLQPGKVMQVKYDGQPVAVYNLDGVFYATHDRCTHVGGPLSQGHMEGRMIICPWHDSCFDVTNGDVTCGPAKIPVKTYRVTVEGEKGRVEALDG